jgi:type III secretion protein L
MKFFSLIKKGDIHPKGDRKILPKESFSQLLTADELITTVKEEIAEYRKENDEECQRLREVAKKEGFEEGLSRLNEHIVHLDLLMKQLRHELTQQILPIALKAAKRIVGRELKTHPDAIVDIVMQALQPATQSHRVKIYVNKADKELVEQEKARIKEILEHIEVLKIQEREDLTPGSCIIETESGIINAELENQWRSLEAAFEKYMKQQGR